MSLTDFERSFKDPNNRVFKLDRMLFLLEELGNPQAKIPSIHIAGTKGKGSTASMIESILSHSGYVTGLFTSPHIHKLINSAGGRQRACHGLENEVPSSFELTS